MSDRMTGISLKGCTDPGWAEYGRKTRAEMISTYRRHAERAKAAAEKILAAADDDFTVETYLGKHAQRNREEVQR